MPKEKSKNFQCDHLRILMIFAVVSMAMFLGFLPASQAAESIFTQTDWSGGATAGTATHTDDQTGWTEFSAKGVDVSATATEATLGREAIEKIFSTDIDFNAGTGSNTDVSGVDDAAVIGLLGTQVTQIATGGYHTCALKNDGTVFCWGTNSYGQLGDNTTVQKLTPVQVLGVGAVGVLSDVSQITAGYYHTCALKNDSTVFCWGNNSNGQLGDNTTVQKLTPIQVMGVGAVGTLADVDQVMSSSSYTCALKNDGTVFCWGINNSGQLGDNTTVQKLTPVQVLGVGAVGVLSDVNQLEIGYAHSCVVKNDNSVFCWGQNDYGQLGDNSTVNKYTPVQVLGVGAVGTLADVSQVEGGGLYTCALKTDKSMFCWGRNNGGQLGDNTNVNKSTPVQVLGVGAVGTLADVDRIEAGYAQAYAIKADKSLFAWGLGSFGQIGDNATVSRWTPVQVLGVGAVGFLTNINQSEGGYAHACALDNDGSVFCWGYNGMGQLGDNTTVQRLTPVQSQVSITYLTPGTYTSSVADLSEAKNFTTLDLTRTVPANTTLTVDVRAGDVAVPDGTWTAWRSDVADGEDIASLSGNRYIQFRIDMATTDIYTTPNLADITFRFSASQTLTSSVYDTETATASLSKIQWTETLPTNTDVRFQLRTSADGIAWGAWCGPDNGVVGTCDSAAFFTDPAGNEIVDDMQKDQSADQYFQYRVSFASTDGMDVPVLSEAAVHYDATLSDGSSDDLDAPTITSINDVEEDSVKLEVALGLANAGGSFDFTIEITDQDEDETETSHQTRTADEDGNVTLAIEDLNSDTEYSFRVKYSLAGADDFSAYSETRSTQTSQDVTDEGCTPTDLKAKAVSTSRIDLSWQDNCGVEDGYRIERRKEGGSFKKIASVDEGEESYRDKNLDPGTTYEYRIRAYRDEDESDYSNKDQATTDEEAEQPSAEIPAVTIPEPVVPEAPSEEPDQAGSDQTEPDQADIPEPTPVLTDANAGGIMPLEDGTLLQAFIGRIREISQIKKIEEFLIGIERIIGTIPMVEKAPAVAQAMGAVAGAASAAVAAAAANPLSGSSGFLRNFGILGHARKKKENWGTVFDFQTKRPVAGASVSILNSEDKVVDSVITDEEGRYGFLAKEGSYTFRINKDDYELADVGKFDEFYGDLYDGTPIGVSSGEMVTRSIAVRSASIDWKEEARKKIRAQASILAIVKKDILVVLFYVGFIATAANFYFNPPSISNSVLLFIYVSLLAARIFFIPKSFGTIQNGSKNPVPFAMVSFYDPQESVRRLAFTVSDILGRYYLLIKNGSYLMKVQGQELDGRPFSKMFKITVKDGVVKEDVVV